MIRPAQPSDRAALLTVAIESGLFDEDQADGLGAEIAGYFESPTPTHRWYVHEAGGDVVAAAYVEPELFAEGTWNLQFLAVSSSHQGSGLGAALVAHVEGVLRSSRGRVLIVETSSVESFESTRAFYAKLGFVEEARIRDFYAPGDGKVVFWKSLT